MFDNSNYCSNIIWSIIVDKVGLGKSLNANKGNQMFCYVLALVTEIQSRCVGS